MTKIKFIDLFGVPGGLSLGFKMAGLKPLATLDVFEHGLQTFAKNFPEVPKERIVKVDAKSHNVVSYFRTRTKIRKGDVDVIAGGPPCQGFSIAGRVKIASLVKDGQRKGRSTDPKFIDDPRNSLYKTFVKFAKYYKPKVLVMENVPGMISYRDGWVLRQIKGDFRRAGYKNVEIKVLNAADYGTPQKRKRIFIVGTKRGSNFTWPKITHGEDTETAQSKAYVTVRDAIGDLPRISIPERGAVIRDIPRRYTKPVTEYQRWARKRSNGIVNNHITRWHRPIDRKIFSIMRQGDTWESIPIRYRRRIGYSNKSFLDKWKKLEWNKPSWTVVAHLYKDGYMFIHPRQLRTISVREAARLQGFPDDFIFEGSRSSQFKQIGNAVPPILAKAVGTRIRKTILSKK